MASNNKSNKADKSVDKAEGFTEVVNNTDIQESHESGMNTVDN